MWVAIAGTIAWIGWTAVDSLVLSRGPGDHSYLAGNSYFHDERYREALKAYEEALTENPHHIHALRAKAASLLQLGRCQQALAAFDEAIRRRPGFGAAYANRGILHDRMGHYEAAVNNDETALAVNPELADGSGWLTRFFRKQTEPPPTIADRARYIREQLALPESQRVLRKPRLDAEQRPYEM
jgi:tetratricopeptide (TPR) repeat protein